MDVFGATLAITGSVQRTSERVRLTVNLVDTKTLRQLKAFPVDAEIRDVSVLQDGIVIKVAEMLGLPVSPEARQLLLSGGTTQPSAYDYYVQGKGYLQRHESIDSVEHAITLFGRAVEHDPQYALALAALGEAHWRKYEITKEP